MTPETLTQIENAATLADLCQVLRAAGRVDDETMGSLPRFGGVEPEDTARVWSWDETSLLVGTCASDLEIVPREQ